MPVLFRLWYYARNYMTANRQASAFTDFMETIEPAVLADLSDRPRITSAKLCGDFHVGIRLLNFFQATANGSLSATLNDPVKPQITDWTH
jgi:hypothetical protein